VLAPSGSDTEFKNDTATCKIMKPEDVGQYAVWWMW